MIGQKKLIDTISKLTVDNMPHFIVFVGERGSGKTTLSKFVADTIGATFTISGIKVDEIREVINTAYTIREKTVYCIQNADTMRNEAKNAMLKITEEPPANAWFILTVEDDSNLLATIKSRANVFYIEPYTVEELKTYIHKNYNEAGDEVTTICNLASTPYEVDKLIEYGKEFIEYVELVADNIAEVEPANAFKSSCKLAIKNDAGYDLKLFWRVFVDVCIRRIHDDIKYANGALVTIPYECKVMKLGVNKQQLYDSWVFEIREAWL